MGRVVVLMGLMFLWASSAWAEEGESTQDDATSADGVEAEDDAPEVPEALLRLGRVESVLIANEDPLSALEFAQEMVREGMDTPRLRLLMGACLMQLDRHAEAIEQWQRAAREAGDAQELELWALYNIARAHHRANQHAEAAAAYERYAAFAEEHEELTSFIEIARRLASRLRDYSERD